MAPARTLGIDVGGTKVHGIVLDGDGSVLARHRVPTPAGSDAVLGAVTEVATRLRADAPGVAAIGVGMPGLVDRRGVLNAAPNLPGVVDVDVASAVETALGLPVRVDNDATCAAAAEHRAGAAVGFDDVVMVTLGTGIGGAWIAGGCLQRGASGFAGEIGHMIVNVDGAPCACGRRGCWEAYASGRGLGWLAREAVRDGGGAAIVKAAGGNADAVRGEHVSAAASDGDEEASALFDRWATWVALGLVNLVQAVDPALIVLGGGVVTAGTLLLDPVRAAFSSLADPPSFRAPPSIVVAALGEEAGAIGAAYVARERLA